jgi:two-component system, NtrC family, sensor kinase
VNLIQHTYQLQGIQLRVESEPQKAWVRGDPGQIQQVLLALLVNAGDAMPQGGEVTVAAAVEGERVSLRVRDNGPGIPEDLQQRIFEPFFSTKEDGQGTGLGLAIASGIVEQHDGAIAVTSAPGKGSEFHIRLPLARVPSTEGAIS